MWNKYYKYLKWRSLIDPDSVDGMCSHEIYIESPDLRNKTHKIGCNFYSTEKYAFMRKNLKSIIDPIIERRVTPYVRKLYSANSSPERFCTPCYCFIRKYSSNDRTSHATHRDGHAYATVVISLSDYEKEYRGGIYIATTERNKQHIPLTVAMQSFTDTTYCMALGENDGGTRYSLILWYKDSIDCIDYSKEWFKEKAFRNSSISVSLC